MKSKHIRPHGTRNTPAMGNPFPSRILLSLSGLSLLLLTGTSHAAGLAVSGGEIYDFFGQSVSQSGNTGLIGAIGANSDKGSAYLFRNLDASIGTVTQQVKLTASDGAASDYFGSSVSLSGSIGLVGAGQDAIGANSYQGSAYVFRNLDTATGTVTQNAKLIASDGAINDSLGYSVSLSGSIGLVGAQVDDIGANSNQGSAYVFRNLDTAIGTVTQNAKLTASDGAVDDYFGRTVSLSGSIGLVGSMGHKIGFGNDQGSAYVFRNLDTATGTVTQNVKLTASDGAGYDQLGYSVSQSGNIGLVGAVGDTIGANTQQGSAYVFRNLDAATGTVTQNVKLTASDGATYDYFGYSASLSGNIGLVGAYRDDIGANVDQGSAYVFRNLDTATGMVTQNVKLIASDGVGDNYFGSSVSLDGDQFIIGADGKNVYTGKAYSGSVSSVTTLNTGSTSKTISGISFTSQDDWIIGDTTDANQVTLSAGDTANVTASGKSVFIGKNAGSDNNTLIVAGTLTANQITIGAAGNTGNTLQIGTGSSTGTLSAASVITNNGSLIFNRSGTLTQGTDFGSAAITGTGSVTQAGPGTTVLNAANTYTGGTTIKSGTLQVSAGGSISQTAADIIIGNTSGDSGSLVINGGSVTNGGSSIGNNAGSNGNATISSGTWTSANQLTVGHVGTGTLLVNGGAVNCIGGSIGDNAGSIGSATISSGTWVATYFLHVGVAGTGSLLVNGGSVTSGNVDLGYFAGSNGSATISSGGVSLNNGQLVVGVSGTGSMNLTGSGGVSVNNGTGTLRIAQYSGSTGTLNIGTGGTAGTLHAAVVNGGAGTATVNFNHTGNYTFAPNLTGSLSVNKLGSGTTTLTGNNTYTGTTTVTGGTLVINGAVASTSVVVDGKLSGSGVMANATLSGSGSINPGNSPGVMTVSAANPTAGLDFYFEFTAANAQPTWNAQTASGNDVLRLTAPTPFTASLSAVNAVNIYLNAGVLSLGEVFTGGFYTDSNTAFLSSISSGSFTYLVANMGGAILYNGTNYDVYSGPLTFSLATVSRSADFGAGVVSGYTTQFTVVPEPGACTLLGLGLGSLLIRRRSRPHPKQI